MMNSSTWNSVTSRRTFLSQFGGYAPAPERLKGKAIAMNLFGDGIHMIATPLDENTMAIA